MLFHSSIISMTQFFFCLSFFLPQFFLSSFLISFSLSVFHFLHSNFRSVETRELHAFTFSHNLNGTILSLSLSLSPSLPLSRSLSRSLSLFLYPSSFGLHLHIQSFLPLHCVTFCPLPSFHYAALPVQCTLSLSLSPSLCHSIVSNKKTFANRHVELPSFIMSDVILQISPLKTSLIATAFLSR